MPAPSLPDTSSRLRALAERWAPSTANERSSFQSWMLDLLDALGAERPVPPTDGHRFERGSSYLAFRTTARTLAAEAVARKDVLVRHGLAEKVLDDLQQAIVQFDQAIEQGTNGRRAHVAASAELETLSEEIVQLVKGMHGLNRFRFAAAPELLAAWESASNVFTVAPSRPLPGGEGGAGESEVQPAA